MNDVTNVETDRERSLKTIGHVSYLLHLIVAIGAVIPGVQASVILLVVAFVLDLVKREDAAGTWQESHFRWRIRSVLWAGGLYILTSPLFLLLFLPGLFAWALISIWFLYRIVRGWLNLSNNAPMPS
ncbi:MAG TPA: hypothetical protein VF169_25730 [Albitalea sp.]|uniref:DUF4870 family protein n=1 Tax=Piscinibacter sp. TaxID=1903157 RepID=UPI002ED1E35E